MVSRNPLTKKSTSFYILLTSAREFLELRDTVEGDIVRAMSGETGRAPSAGGVVTRGAPASAPERDFNVELLRTSSARLAQALERYVEAVSLRAPYMSSQIVRDAQFALAGFADESLLHHPSGRLGGWQNHLLEENMFRSRNAGESFFYKLNEILYNLNNDTMPLLILYLAVLRMGFLGKFRGSRDRVELDRIRGNALARIMETINFDPSTQTSISPSAYENTISSSEIVKMPLRGQWRLILFLSIGALIVFTTLGWIRLVTPLDTQINRVLSIVVTPVEETLNSQ